MFLRNYFNNVVKNITNKLKAFRFIQLYTQYNSKSNSLKYLILILLIFNFIFLAINEINSILDPQWYDTTAYLGEANFIKYHGGVFNFFYLCIKGIYKQANQHPLYILILTPFASINISFFIVAKIVSAVFGLIMLTTLFVIGKKLFGDIVASVAVFGILLSNVFLTWTSGVACESLLMLMSLLCIYFVMEGFKDNKYWIYAGLFAGLSYLTKGTGILLLPGFVLSAAIIYKQKVFLNRFFWLFFVLFTVAASPLLIRNIVVYQNPFYNVNNNIITMGQDKINETVYHTFDLKEGVAIWKYEKSVNNNSVEVKNENSLSKFSLNLSTFSKKFVREYNIFLDALGITTVEKLHLKGSMRLLTFLIPLFFIVGILREKNTGGKLYFLITILVFFASLFIMPIDRFFLPLIPFTWIYISLGIFISLDFIYKKFFLARHNKFNLISYVPHIMVIILLLFLTFTITKKEVKNPLNSVEYSENSLDLLQWLRDNLKKDDLYTMGPNFNWQLEKGTWVLPPRIYWGNMSKFESFIRRHHILYIIMDLNTLEDFSSKFNFTGEVISNKKNDMDEYFAYDPINGITEKKRVDGWDLIYKDKKEPVEFLVYKTLTEK